MTGKEEQELLARITANPGIFEGKPIIRGRRLQWNIFGACKPPAVPQVKSSNIIPFLRMKTSGPASFMRGGSLHSDRLSLLWNMNLGMNKRHFLIKGQNWRQNNFCHLVRKNEI